MSERYPGGLINRSAPVVVGPTNGEGGSASGIWTLEQAAGYIKQGLWPKPTLPRQLFSWGANGAGQLGQNNTNDLSSPVQVGSLTDWSQLSRGGNFSVIVKTNGTLWSWGGNDSGSLGQNDVVRRSSPVQVGALTDWSQASAGTAFCAVVKTNGTLWTWGSNNAGQLGLDIATLNVTRSSPVQVGALTDWSQAVGGNEFCAAVKTNGTLWTWGHNGFGQLGLNNSGASAYRSSPVQVGALTDWSKISASNFFCAAIKTNGTLWTWGDNGYGELGTNTTSRRSSPVQVGALTNWAQVSAGGFFCAAIKTDGTLWTWGGGIFGPLGQNNSINLSSPVQVGALTNWSQVSGGRRFCTAIKTDGTLWTWGWNSSGRLGLNDVNNRSSPVQIGSVATWSSISQGSQANHTLAITIG